MISHYFPILFFFFNDTATTEIYTLSLHDALPISHQAAGGRSAPRTDRDFAFLGVPDEIPHDQEVSGIFHLLDGDRKSTRLNSSHGYISYAVFCLKKKTTKSLPS